MTTAAPIESTLQLFERRLEELKRYYCKSRAAVSSPPFQTSGLETAHERQRLRFWGVERQLVVLSKFRG